jgi:hypothetical protein
VQALTIALIISLCCLLIWYRRHQRASKVKDEWDIREATFLYQTRGLGADPCYLEANYLPISHPQPKVTETAFTNPIDPPPPAPPPPPPVVIALPDEFMKRFAEKGRNLKRSSECEATADGVVDKKTGQKGGYIFTVSNISWISPNEVQVSGGLWAGKLAGTSKTYYLKKADSQWQIVGEHLESISCG